MPIRVLCDCGQKLVAGDHLARKQFRCPTCRQLIRLPSPDSASALNSEVAPESESILATELRETLSLLDEKLVQSTESEPMTQSEWATFQRPSQEEHVATLNSSDQKPSHSNADVPAPTGVLLYFDLLTQRVGIPAWVLISVTLLAGVLLQLTSGFGRGQTTPPQVKELEVQPLPQETFGFGVTPTSFEAIVPKHVKFASHPTIPSIRMASFDNAVVTFDFRGDQVTMVTLSFPDPENELRMTVFLTLLLNALAKNEDEGTKAALWMLVARDIRASERKIVGELDFVPQKCELVADFEHIRLRSHSYENGTNHFIIEPVGAPRGQLEFSKRK